MGAMETSCSIVPHPDEPRALLLAGERGWALPEHDADRPPAIRQLMRERFGLDVTVLGVVGGRYRDAAREDPVYVFALETHAAPSELPAEARWFARADLAGLTLATPAHRTALERWFAEAEGGAVPAERVPWARPGWLARAEAWIRERLGALGAEAVGPAEQILARAWSCVLRVPTAAGPVYFKAVSAPASAFEPPLTQALTALFPAELPPLLAVDAPQCWMLLGDAGTPLRAAMLAERDPAPYAAMLARMARLQVAAAPDAERLVALGCPDKRLARLPALFEALAADRSAMLVGRAGGLSEADHARLEAAAGELRALCAELAAYRVPETLVQEDMHPGHVVATPDGFTFFDWGDTCVSHPFYALMMGLRWARLVLGFDADALARLQAAYLAEWTAYEPPERLAAAHERARRLALVCRALTWHALVAHAEPAVRWEFEDGPPYWMRLFLDGED